MRRSLLVAFVAGALLSVGLGIAIALLPTTPTWALWRLTVAIDQRDTEALQSMVDVPAVVSNALKEDLGELGGLGGIGELALTVFRGGRVRTAFDDPGVEIGASDFLAAWWTLERNGDSARLTLPVGERPIHLDLGRGPDLRWRVTAVSPLDALLRIEPPRGSKSETP
jgi:hypothetical protein